MFVTIIIIVSYDIRNIISIHSITSPGSSNNIHWSRKIAQEIGQYHDEVYQYLKEDWRDGSLELATIYIAQVLPIVFRHKAASDRSHNYRSNTYQARYHRQVDQRDNLYETKLDSAHNILVLRPSSEKNTK